jgi:hypothetical protein
MRQFLPGAQLTSLEDGIRRTAADYRRRRDAADVGVLERAG